MSGFYHQGGGWLYRLDPRARMFTGIVGIILILLHSSIPSALALILLSQIVLLSGGVSYKRLLKSWWSLLPLIMAVLILQPLVYVGEGEKFLSLGSIIITHEGIRQGILIAVKLAGAACFSMFPLITTPPHLLIRAFDKMGLPYRVGLMIGLALNDLSMLGEMYSQILDAQQARGLDFSESGFFRKVKNFIPSLIALIIGALRAGDDTALALAARGYGMISTDRTSYFQLRMNQKDWLYLTANLIIFLLSFFI